MPSTGVARDHRSTADPHTTPTRKQFPPYTLPPKLTSHHSRYTTHSEVGYVSNERLVRQFPKLVQDVERRIAEVAAPTSYSFVAPYTAKGTWPGDPTMTRALVLLCDDDLQHQRELVQCLQRWYEDLDLPTQRLVQEHYWKNTPLSEIAQQWELPTGHLRKHLRRVVDDVARYLPAQVG